MIARPRPNIPHRYELSSGAAKPAMTIGTKSKIPQQKGKWPRAIEEKQARYIKERAERHMLVLRLAARMGRGKARDHVMESTGDACKYVLRTRRYPV